MELTTDANLALLILRVVVGLTLAAHGWNKFTGGGKIPGTGRWFDSIGMRPGRLNAYLAASTELGAAGAPAAERCSVLSLFVVGGGKRPAHVWGGDVLVLPVEDGYRQIAQKVVGALAWASEHAPFKYVLKTDDDSFVCVSRLLELLRPSARERLYMGVVNARHKVVTSEESPYYERWRDPLYVRLFNRTVYADYMQGAGYVLSADLAALAVQRAAALSPTLGVHCSHEEGCAAPPCGRAAGRRATVGRRGLRAARLH